MKYLRLPYDGLDIRDVLFKTVVESHFRRHERIETLEAGCGRKWALNNVRGNFKITGVDLDRDAYEIRNKRHGDIEIFHHKSLEDYENSNSFDLVYCVDVLEHCSNTDKIIGNLISSLKVDGIAIIAFPNKNSLFGRLTYHTPHWFHIWFYRVFYNQKEAGTSGFGPYPVVYEDTLISKNFEKKVTDSKVEICYKITREFDYRRLGLWRYIYLPFLSACKYLFGPNIGESGLIYILKKVS